MDKKVLALMINVEKSIIIPKRLSENLITKNEGATLYLLYRSSLKPISGGFSISNVSLTIRLDAFTTRDSNGEIKYNGNKITSKNVLSSGIEPPSAVKNPDEYTKVVEIINKWIKDNDTQMFSTIGL
jgi:hypothetical protein